MKSKDQKRKEAYTRLLNSTYDNSKAKRKGIDEETWQRMKDSLINVYKEKYHVT